MKTMLYFFLFSYAIASVAQHNLTVLSWNVESGGNDSSYVAQRLRDLEGIDLLGLSEVRENEQNTFTSAAAFGENASYNSVLGQTGGGDRLLIIYNDDRFDLLDQNELDNINIDGTVRSPLVVHIRDNHAQKEFLFMVNHLARNDRNGGTPNRRQVQAQMLNQWVANQTLPVIAVGDYNFDFEIDSSTHDPAMDLLLENQHFFWVYPPLLVRTNCNFNFDDAILDFFFVNRQGLKWSPESEIMIHYEDCLIPNANSDHRAIIGYLSVK